MAKRKHKKSRLICAVCEQAEPRYTCPGCEVKYCSLSCYKQHKEVCHVKKPEVSQPARVVTPPPPIPTAIEDEIIEKPLRPLSSLRWPYIPQQPSWQDPLEANDPKPLRLQQYENIASSKNVRAILEGSTELKKLLSEFDQLRGRDREQALEYMLGVADPRLTNPFSPKLADVLNHDSVKEFRKFADAVTRSINDGKSDSEIKELLWEE